MQAPTADWLLSHITMDATGRAAWHDPIPERGSGVYIVSISEPADVDLGSLPIAEQSFWVAEQAVLYIGRTKHLSRRLSEFRRHIYGRKSPHRGGQAILNIYVPKEIRWAATDDYVRAERTLLQAFRKHVGAWPFGNRMAASREGKDSH